MSTRALTRPMMTPSLLDEFFRPWNEWFNDSGIGIAGKPMTVPAVNVTEADDHYTVAVASPGLTKDDFKINLEGNMLTISAAKEENKEEKEDKYTRKEYNYSSFSRSFTLPEDVKDTAIEAKYDNGVLKINLPRKEAQSKASLTRHINVN